MLQAWAADALLPGFHMSAAAWLMSQPLMAAEACAAPGIKPHMTVSHIAASLSDWTCLLSCLHAARVVVYAAQTDSFPLCPEAG